MEMVPGCWSATVVINRLSSSTRAGASSSHGWPSGCSPHRSPNRRARLDAFAAGYGATRGDLIAAALTAQRAEIERVVGWGAAGLDPWATLLRRGLDTQARAELAWLEANAGALA